jgi:hypothetical protein
MLWIEMTSFDSPDPPLVTRKNPPKCNQRICNYVSVGLGWYSTTHAAMIVWGFFEFGPKCFCTHVWHCKGLMQGNIQVEKLIWKNIQRHGTLRANIKFVV